MDWMKRAWHGEEKLWKVFWIYGFTIELVLGILRFVALFFVPAASMPLLVVRIIYSIWMYIATWRCAFNVDWRGWGYIARILVVLGVIGMITGLAMEYFISTNDLLKQSGLDTGSLPMQMSKSVHMDNVNPQPVYQAEMLTSVTSATAPGLAPASAPVVPAAAVPTVTTATVTPPSVVAPSVPSAAVASPPPATVSPSVPSVPAPASVTTAAAEQYRAKCEKTMSDFATQHNADPKQYIQQNQAYLDQCMNYYTKAAAGPTPVPTNRVIPLQPGRQ